MTATIGRPAAPVRVPVGLEGVILCDTEISDVDGEHGRYRYRDYDAIELARWHSLEDVWHLLLMGELPAPAQHAAFCERIVELRSVPAGLEPVLVAAARAGAAADPMAGLRSAVSLLGGVLGWEPMIDLDETRVREQALQTCAMLPALIATLHRSASGQPLVSPDPELGQAASFLQLLHGRTPQPAHARALEQYLILAADHGLAASTLSGRVIASTGADFAAAVAGAIGALSGPLHGGAPDRVMRMLDEIHAPKDVDSWLRDHLSRGERIMGFGHRIYRAPDPRARMLRELVDGLGSGRMSLAEHVESQATALLDEAKPGRRLRVNVEFYASVLIDHIGIPRSLFAPTFALARVAGWSAHILEQIADNRLIRPITEFRGGPLRPVAARRP